MTRGYVRYVSFDVNSVCRRSKQNIPSFFLMPAVQSALCPQTGLAGGLSSDPFNAKCYS